MLYQISSTDVRCVFEVLPNNIPSISDGEMATFVKNTIAPQVHYTLGFIQLKNQLNIELYY